MVENINEVEIRLVLNRLRPVIPYGWRGSGVKLNSEEVWDNVVFWTDTDSIKPTEQEMIDEYNAYLLEIQAEDIVRAREASAESQAAAIPNWSTWTSTETTDWIETNVTDLESAKTVLLAMAKMIVALRNKSLPKLEGN